MAWIIWQKGLEDTPEIAVIARRLNISTYEACGRMMALWAWADGQTVTGFIKGADATMIDDHFGMAGAHAILVSDDVQWLAVEPNGVRIPKFRRHHSQSARARALSAVRARRYRAKRKKPTKKQATRKKPSHRFKSISSLLMQIDRGVIESVNGHKVKPGICRIKDGNLVFLEEQDRIIVTADNLTEAEIKWRR